MGFFNFIESFFFISLAITFVLIMMIIYHFKERINVIEKKNETTIEILNNLAKEVTGLRGFVLQMNSVQQPPMPSFMSANSPFFKMVSSMDGQDGYSQRNNITIDLEEDDDNICVEHLNIGEDLSNSIYVRDVDADADADDDEEEDEDSDEDDDEDEDDDDDDKENFAESENRIEKIVVLDEPAAPEPTPISRPTPVDLEEITEVPVAATSTATTESANQIPEDYTKLTTVQLKNIVLDKKIYTGNVNKLKRNELLKLLQQITL